MNESPFKLLFDGECPRCRREAQFLQRRYREATLSLGGVGGGVVNSLSDILLMALGFLFASRARPWVTVAAIVAMEVGCAFWVRDNLTLNIIMLNHPFDAIKHCQMAGASVG